MWVLELFTPPVKKLQSRSPWVECVSSSMSDSPCWVWVEFVIAYLDTLVYWAVESQVSSLIHSPLCTQVDWYAPFNTLSWISVLRVSFLLLFFSRSPSLVWLLPSHAGHLSEWVSFPLCVMLYVAFCDSVFRNWGLFLIYLQSQKSVVLTARLKK